MLAEFFLLALTPASRPMRRLAYAQDSVRLWSRARRCRAAWAPHEARCQAIVCAAFADLPMRRTAVVLGSGLLRDVPLDALCAAFGKVVLVDAVHLPPVRRRAARYANVTLEARDLSGAADWLLGRAMGRADPVGDLAADPSVDFVVSANLLSQLPLAPERRLDAAPKAGPPDLPDRIVGWHLDDLARFQARVCLITDVDSREIRRDGAQGDRLDLLRGHALPSPDEAWDWTVAPFGEESRRYSVVHRVQAYRDLAAARRRAAMSV